MLNDNILHEILGVTLVAVNSYVGTQLIATGEMKTVIANSPSVLKMIMQELVICTKSTVLQNLLQE